MHLRLCDTLVSYFIMIFRLVNEWKTKRTAANAPAFSKALFLQRFAGRNAQLCASGVLRWGMDRRGREETSPNPNGKAAIKR